MHKTIVSDRTKIYAVETKKKSNLYRTGYTHKTTPKWSATVFGVGGAGGAIYFPTTLANIDSDSRKEVITAYKAKQLFHRTQFCKYVHGYHLSIPCVRNNKCGCQEWYATASP